MDKLLVVNESKTHTIYVTNKSVILTPPVPCTRSAIEAVRDYMLDDMNKDECSVGYQWKDGNGKLIKLVCVREE